MKPHHPLSLRVMPLTLITTLNTGLALAKSSPENLDPTLFAASLEDQQQTAPQKLQSRVPNQKDPRTSAGHEETSSSMNGEGFQVSEDPLH